MTGPGCPWDDRFDLVRCRAVPLFDCWVRLAIWFYCNNCDWLLLMCLWVVSPGKTCWDLLRRRACEWWGF